MTDNRTNESTEAQVEAAAKALYEFETGLAEDSWGRAFEVERSLWRDEARAALVAAQEAAPVPPSSTVDEDALAEVIRRLRFNDAGCWADGIDCTESVSDHADVIARAVAEWLKEQGK